MIANTISNMKAAMFNIIILSTIMWRGLKQVEVVDEDSFFTTTGNRKKAFGSELTLLISILSSTWTVLVFFVFLTSNISLLSLIPRKLLIRLLLFLFFRPSSLPGPIVLISFESSCVACPTLRCSMFRISLSSLLSFLLVCSSILTEAAKSFLVLSSFACKLCMTLTDALGIFTFGWISFLSLGEGSI